MAATKQTDTAAPTLEQVPTEWPGGFGLYKYSKQAVKRNWQTLLVIALLNVAAAAFSGMYDLRDQEPTFLLSVLLQLLASLLGLAATFAYLKSVRGDKVRIGQALNTAAQPLLFLEFFVTNILVAVLLFMSLILLIVPFFFVLPRLFLATYFVVDKDLSPFDAVTASWNATKGHSLKVWQVILATIAMALLVLTIIGIPVAIFFLFMYSAASAVTYFYVLEQAPAAEAK